MGTTTRTLLLLLSAALAGCASAGPSPQWLDARVSPDGNDPGAGGRGSRIAAAAGPSDSC